MGKQRAATSPLVSSSSSSSSPTKLKGKGRASAGIGRASSTNNKRSSSGAANAKDLDISGHAGNINLGNTCFLNSVLQAAAVTVPLQELLEHQWYQQKHQRSPNPNSSGTTSDWTDHEEDDSAGDDDDNGDDSPEACIQRRRRRAAIKGKAKARDSGFIMPDILIGTREAPLSDALRTHLSRAYSHRPPLSASASTSSVTSSRKKSSASANALNPRPLLNALTRKFDQYGDFAQQDAHELLRHLLDACRMEEVDMIKRISKVDAEASQEGKQDPSGTDAEKTQKAGPSAGATEAAVSTSQVQAPTMSKEASSSSEQSTTSSQGGPAASTSTTSSSSLSSAPSASLPEQSDRPTPRLVRPSPIPAHLRTEHLVSDDGDDLSDSDTPVLLGPHPIAGSGELTPMANHKPTSFPFHKSFSPSAQSTPTHPGPIDLSTPTVPHAGGNQSRSGRLQKEAFPTPPTDQKKKELEYRPLIDVVFGGQLASIIVCESCRNIRHTYEDFYDISLPLRDESGSKVSDKSRKRDRIRSMAELWRRAGTSSGASSSANDARALIAKAQLAHDEGDDAGMHIEKRRRGSVAAMSETEVSENDASPAAAAGLMERRRLKAEEAKKQKKERRASIGGITGAESSAGEDKGKNGNISTGAAGSKSIFRASSIRKSLGQMSKSSKESVVSASLSGHTEAMPGSPPLHATTGSGGSGDVVEGLERAVASMNVHPISPGSISSDADPAPALVNMHPNPHPHPPQPSVSPAIFSFWKSARSSSKSPAPSSNSMALSAFDSSSPDFRSRSASPSRAAAFAAKDHLSRPASVAPADQGHLAPPPANAYVLPAQSGPPASGSSVAPAPQTHALHTSASVPAALSAIEEGISGMSLSTNSSTSVNSPMASLLSRTKAPPSSSFTPPSSTQTSPAVLGATRASMHTNKIGAHSHHTGGGKVGRLGQHQRGRGRGPSRQAQYLAKILADVCPPSEESSSANNDRTAPLTAVAESPVDGTPEKAGEAPEVLQRVKSPSAAAALLHRMNGSSPNPPHHAEGIGPGEAGGTHSHPPTSSEVIASEFETGLGRALCQFTKVELLEGENAFKCRRCWRIAHPRTMQERQQRRERERQRKIRQGSKKAAAAAADGEEEDENDEEEKRDSSETPSSDLDTSDEDVDAVLELPPSVNRPALTRSNLQMNASNLASNATATSTTNNNFSPGSSRRSSVDSDALEVMGASILSAPGKLGEAANLSSLQALTTVRPPPAKGDGQETPPPIPSIHMSVPASSDGAEEGAKSLDSAGRGGGGNGSAPNGGSSGQRSMTASSASLSPRESMESARPVELSSSDQGSKDAAPGAASATQISAAKSASKPRASGSIKASTATASKSGDSNKKKVTEAIERRALKRYLIASAPPVLVFHFKRFQSNTSRFSGRRSRPGDFSKIDDPVSFPEFFDVSPWLAPPREEYNRLGALKATSDPAVLAKAKEDELALAAAHANPHHSPTVYASQLKAPRSPFRFLRSHSPSTPKQEWFSAPPLKSKAEQLGTLYQLYAVVNHQGNMTGGHYTAYVLSDRVRSKQPKTEKQVTVKRAASRSHSRQVSSASTRSQLGFNVTNAASPDEDQDGAVTPPGAATQDSSVAHNGALVEDESEDTRQWLHVSDATVRPATVSEVFSSKYVYMLFYERL
ncbi:hypothetical protein OC861_003820 [Tilletia horrida]|nr:hypothetical protein OC845_000950 [Tilletia horrida]KAK0565346.1 hypothetical protein OC861_003820 [Tilletia horrida]